MSRLPDLVIFKQLDTEFIDSDLTCHLYSDSVPASWHDTRPRKEYWKRRRDAVGKGSYGVVWLEKCVKGQAKAQLRAVKQFPAPITPKECVRELLAMAIFSHDKYAKNFVRLFGWYETPAHDLFIAMEYLGKGDLQRYLAGSPPLPISQARQITFQLLEGLSAMHEQGFAHRDLKPGNILIHSQPPQEWWVKIADFGLSKRVEEVTCGPSTIVGTPGYWAPETKPETRALLVRLKKSNIDLGLACDMWSLGEITHRLLTKSPVFLKDKDLIEYVQGNAPFPSISVDDRMTLCQSFVHGVMRADPDLRMTVLQAREHDWMEEMEIERLRRLSIGSVDVEGLDTYLESKTIHDSLEASKQWSATVEPVTQDRLGAKVSPKPHSSEQRHLMHESTDISTTRNIIRVPKSSSEPPLHYRTIQTLATTLGSAIKYIVNRDATSKSVGDLGNNLDDAIPTEAVQESISRHGYSPASKTSASPLQDGSRLDKSTLATSSTTSKAKGLCVHKIESGCRLESLLCCCACADKRDINSAYPMYYDGGLTLMNGRRYEHYCPACKAFWMRKQKDQGRKKGPV